MGGERRAGRAADSSRPIDVRTALIEHFRDDAAIMLATEAAAEGVNLQFCSLVVNYDLPWNPQRVEQRIGRCHRYGQQHDVVVINFLNERNEADKRVLELLARSSAVQRRLRRLGRGARVGRVRGRLRATDPGDLPGVPHTGRDRRRFR